MKLFFKISLALVFLLVIAVIGFALLFNPNDYKEDIISLVKEKTGRELAIPGDISLSLLVPLVFVKKLSIGKSGRAGILFMLFLSAVAMIVFIGLRSINWLGGAFLIMAYFFTIYAMWSRREIDIEE